MATRYNTLRARLTDAELEMLRALPGDNDSERVRQAIARARKENQIIVGVADALIERIDARLSAALEAEREQTAQRAADLVGAKLKPVFAGIIARLPQHSGGN